MQDSQTTEKTADAAGAFPVTVYHNPNCGTSRNTLALLRDKGLEPTVVEYLKTGWTRPQLLALFKAMGVTPREAMREKCSPAAELGLLESGTTDDQIIDAMIAHPILVNRPIVVTPKGTALTRPMDRVLDLL